MRGVANSESKARCVVSIGVQVLIVVLIVGIIASIAIAIPAYESRENYSKVYRTMHRAHPLRVKVEERILKTGRIPALASEVPDAAPINVDNIATAQLKNNGVILVRFMQSAGARLAGTVIELTPILKDDELSWRCDGGTEPPTYRSATCWAGIPSDSNLAQSYMKYQGPSDHVSAQINKVYRAMREVKPLHRKVQEHILRHGFIPASVSEVPGNMPIKVQDMAVAQLHNNGVILIEFEQSLGKPLAGATIELTPIIEGNVLSWRCDRGTLPRKYRSSTCWLH